jgi:DNA primase
LASISDEKLQELRDRVDLVAVVQRRVPLKKSGHDWKGLCPIHGEKTPSFYVIPDKKMFHCFGCGVSGDAIKFVMQVEGRSFREAVEQLANEAGVDLTPPDPEEARRSARRGALAEVNEKACTFYERVLWEHPKGEIAREHLRKRGITEDTAKVWRLGYAPNLWDSLIKSHTLQGVDPRLVEEAGLGVPRKKGQGLYDRFRGRLMIPIRESGRILGFGGRLLEGESEAKYLNSPDTPLYQKGLTLFGLDRARDSIRAHFFVLFVEGYFDVIGLHQGGLTTAVATCGTALTEKHLELVLRAGTKRVVFVFDPDTGGIRGAQRASEITARAGIPASVLVPAAGEDPDELLARVARNRFNELLSCAQPSLEFLLDRALAVVPADAPVEDRANAVHAVAGIVGGAPDKLARDLYIEKISQRLGIAEDAIRRALAGKTVVQKQESATSQQNAPPLVLDAEVKIAALVVAVPEARVLLGRTGAIADFVMPALRDFVDRVCSEVGAADALLRALEPDWLRERLVDATAEFQRAGAPADAERNLELKLERHAQVVALEEAARFATGSKSLKRSEKKGR